MKITTRLLIATSILAVLLFGATTGNIQWTQLASAVRHGTATKGQSSDGTGTSGNCVKYDASGNVTDAGAACGAVVSGTAGGDLSGSYPNPTVAQVNGAVVPASASIVGSNSSRQLAAATAAALSAVTYVAGGGTANAQTATYSPAIGSLVAGLALCWLPSNANTTSTPTFAPNSLTAKTITKAGGSALVASDLTTTAIACANYDGTSWELQNPQTGAGGFSNPMTTKGDVIVGGTSGAPQRLAVGTNTYCLTANSSATNGVDWEACSSSGGPTTMSIVTGSRAATTNYQNTTGKMLYVSIRVSVSGGNGNVFLTVGTVTPIVLSATTAVSGIFGTSTPAGGGTLFAMVPNNYYYSLDVSAAGAIGLSISTWTEWN